MIIVNVKIKPKANCKQDFINAFNNVAELVRQEDGCLEYELHQKLTSDSELFLFERWESKPALDKHLNAEHMIEYIAQVKGLLEVKNELNIYEAEKLN
ncbi:putative quinol monooxygenase [Labilibaculum manganireducens]|uniref:putative quinol monooxygenase n=1 Tax=Labilibaculum manganireducens TaxID=1940525 RepID=UPI0029F50FE2|nr:putative quinol monooxygenase [Labilibaculum manganireducens]